MLITRRHCWAALALACLLAPAGESAPKSGKAVLYAAVGRELNEYSVDLENASLTRRASVMLPDSVQYAWPHPSGKYFYVGWSNGAGSSHHGLSAFRIDRRTGELVAHGTVPLRWRPVHITLDIPGTHILVAYNDPSGLTVHNIESDGTIGSEVQQPAQLDFGIYGHQVRVAPSNGMVILVTRGNGPTAKKAEDPGALKVMSYRDGVLTSRMSVAPNRGFGFQPRHLDFAGSWIFVSLERQNQIQVYKKLSDEAIGKEPLFTKSSLTHPGKSGSGQAASTIHVHPNGKFVYQGNRSSSPEGQNAIAVWAINRETGEPTLIQNADTHGSTPRTFALDASGRILVAANQSPMNVKEGSNVSTVPAGLAVFRVQDDGKLEFVRKYDLKTEGANNLFWMGIVSLP